MMAGTAKGREVRRYYLTVEKKYRESGATAITAQLNRIEDSIKTARLLSPREIQMRELEGYLFDRVVLTGDKRDHIEFHRLFYDHETHLTRPIPKDAFATAVVYLFPQIRVSKRYGGTEFIGCRLKVPTET
jgi:hypothetical protein